MRLATAALIAMYMVLSPDVVHGVGLIGIPLPGVEIAIAASAILLGVLVSVERRSSRCEVLRAQGGPEDSDDPSGTRVHVADLVHAGEMTSRERNR
jgi:hypothetical protein